MSETVGATPSRGAFIFGVGFVCIVDNESIKGFIFQRRLQGKLLQAEPIWENSLKTRETTLAHCAMVGRDGSWLSGTSSCNQTKDTPGKFGDNPHRHPQDDMAPDMSATIIESQCPSNDKKISQLFRHNKTTLVSDSATRGYYSLEPLA